jgi:hypothetical protein
VSETTESISVNSLILGVLLLIAAGGTVACDFGVWLYSGHRPQWDVISLAVKAGSDGWFLYPESWLGLYSILAKTHIAGAFLFSGFGFIFLSIKTSQ